MTPDIHEAFKRFITFRQQITPLLPGWSTPDKLVRTVLTLSSWSNELNQIYTSMKELAEAKLVTEILATYSNEDKGGRLAMFFACRSIRDKLLGPGCPRTMAHDDNAFHTVVGEQFEGKGTLRVEYLYELYRAVSNGKEAGQYG